MSSILLILFYAMLSGLAITAVCLFLRIFRVGILRKEVLKVRIKEDKEKQA